MPLDIYVSKDGYAFDGVYQTVGKLPGMSDLEQSWVIFGACLVDAIQHRKYRDVRVYSDSVMVDEWLGKVKFASKRCADVKIGIESLLKSNFAKLSIVKVDELSLKNHFTALKVKK